jgi:hypothetical protein
MTVAETHTSSRQIAFRECETLWLVNGEDYLSRPRARRRSSVTQARLRFWKKASSTTLAQRGATLNRARCGVFNLPVDSKAIPQVEAQCVMET